VLEEALVCDDLICIGDGLYRCEKDYFFWWRMHYDGLMSIHRVLSTGWPDPNESTFDSLYDYPAVTVKELCKGVDYIFPERLVNTEIEQMWKVSVELRLIVYGRFVHDLPGKPALGLFRVSRNISETARRIFYGKNVFHFTLGFPMLDAWLQTIGPNTAYVKNTIVDFEAFVPLKELTRLDVDRSNLRGWWIDEFSRPMRLKPAEQRAQGGPNRLAGSLERLRDGSSYNLSSLQHLTLEIDVLEMQVRLLAQTTSSWRGLNVDDIDPDHPTRRFLDLSNREAHMEDEQFKVMLANVTNRYRSGWGDYHPAIRGVIAMLGWSEQQKTQTTSLLQKRHVRKSWGTRYA
jgi:hypothetical protein